MDKRVIVKAVDATPDGRILASAGCDDTGRIWHVGPPATPSSPYGGGHDKAVSTALARVAVAVTGDMGGELRLWHLETGALLGEWKQSGGMCKNALAARDGRILLTSAADLEGGSVEALDLSERAERTVWSTGGRSAFSRWMATRRFCSLPLGAVLSSIW